MNETGYAVLKIPKTGAAFAYAKEARDFATGATGAGGYLHTTATNEQWRDVRFVSAILEGSSSLPVSIGASYSDLYTGVATVIGGTTPIGDLRSEDRPYFTVGSSSLYHTKKGQEYGGAFYAAYIGGTNSLPTKIGIGTTAGDISTSGYYEGSFTTNNIHEFQTSFDADSTDLSKITTGSGVYTEGADVTLQFNILNRNGEQLSSAAQIAADPFVSGQKISILNTDGTVAFADYRIGGDSTFTFSSSQNIDVFGSFTRNFGIRNQVVNQDGGVHTSEFYLYANTATFDKVFVSSSGQTVLNETYSNHNPPNTGTITSAADRADAIKYFNNQPINDSGVTGFIEFDLGFNESPNFTSLGDLVLFYGTSGDFTTNRGSLVGNFPLNSVQEGQRIRLTANDGIPEGTGLFFKLAADTEVGFNEELFNVGPFTLEPEVEGPDLNLYNQGDQLLVGDFTIEGGLDGDDADGGNLNVSGNALGTGIGGRLTGPDSKMYLLSGDAAGTESDTLQTVTNRGNTTTQSVGIGTTSVSTSKLKVVGNSIEVELATNDGYSIKSSQKAIIAGVGIGSTSINSTGSMIAGGSGHHISGDYDTIAGGTLNNISGGNFNFIGGGSQVDITGSEYSSSVGGRNNDILDSNYSIIGGGLNNKIKDATSSFVGGGEGNQIYDPVSAIVGGNTHLISGGNGYSFIGGGEENEIHGTFSSILGGEGNKLYSSDAVTLGGWFTESSGQFSLVGPGKASKVSGDYAVALGNKVEIPVAHTGATVLADGQDRVHASSGMHTATLDFASGVYVPTIGYFGEGLHVSGVPVLTGENNPAEADTLQTVTNRGNSTSTSILSTGPHISGVTGYYKDTLRVGDGGFVDFPSEYDTLQVGTSSSATNGHILVRGKESSITFRGVEGSDKAHTIKEDGGTLTFYGDSTLSGTAGNARFAIQTGQSYFTDLAGVQANGKKPQFYLASIGGGASNKATHFYQPANSADFRIALNGSQNNGTIGTDAFAIKSTYEIGVGTVDPRAALHVDNGAGATTGFLVENSSNKNILWAEDNESINARSTFNVYHTTVASRYLKLGWGSIFANDDGNELTLGSNFSSNSATRIFVAAESADNTPSDTIQMQANRGLAVFSGVSTDTFEPTALLDVRGDAYISGDVEGTGAGNRITNNGVPYLLSGDSPAETQNLDQVLAQGNTSTRDMSVADISGSGLFLSGAGSAGPEISLQGAYTTWEIENQYAGGANNDMFRIRNTALADDALVINRGNNKVGIGTTNPTNDLHVVGTMQLDNSVSDAFKIRINGGVGLALDHNSIRSTNAGTDVTFAAGKDLIFQTYDGGFQEAMRIDTSGRVGIGTDDPSATFSIGSGDKRASNTDFVISDDTPQIELRDTGNSALISFNDTQGVRIFSNYSTSTSPQFTIENDGNVGIGTATPDDALTIVGTSADFSVRKADNGLAARIAQFSAGGAQLRLYDSGSNETIRLAGDGSNSFITGNVGIGTNSPSSALEVRGGNIDIGTNDIEGAANCKIEMDAADGFTLTNPNNAHGIDIVADDLTFFGGGLGNRKITTNAGDLSIDPTADLLLNETAGNVGIGTDSPTERVEVSGSLLLGPRSSSPGDTMPFLKIDGYDEHGIEMGLSTWTRWRITTKVNGQLEIYNTGIQHQSQQVSIGRQNYHKQGNLLVYSTGSVLRAGHNSANYPILDIGVQDAPAGASAYRGDAYIDVRASTSTPSRFHFKRDGEFIASGVSVSGDVLGTGVGNRITNNHVPYLLSGDSPAETQTLQDVCDNGNTTTTSIGIGTNSPDGILNTSGDHVLFQGVNKGYIRARTERASVSDYTSVSSSILTSANYFGQNEYGQFVDNAGNFVIQKSGLATHLLKFSTTDMTVSGYGIKFAKNQTVSSLAVDLRNENGDEVGFYSPATNEIGFVTDRTEHMRIDSAGNVGIGTTNPSDKLHVEEDGGTVAIGSPTTSYGGIGFEDTALTAANSALYGVASQTVIGVKAGGSIEMKIANNSSLGLLKMEQDKLHYTDGDVGIGTTAPAAKLELLGKQMITAGANAQPQTEDYLYIGGDGLAGADAAIYIGNRGNGSGYGWRMFYEGTGSGNNNKLKFKSENLGSPVDVITMLQDGKVGIGATEPSVGLQLGNSTSGQTKTAIFNSEGGAEVGLTIKSRTNRAKLAVSDNDTTAYVVAEGTIASFGRADTAATTNISVLANGDVGIGTTGPSNNLEIKGSGGGTDVLNLNKGTGEGGLKFTFNGTNFVSYIRTYEAAAVADNYMALGVSNGNNTTGAEVMRLKGDGKVGIGTTSPSNALDVVGHFSATSKSFLIDHPTKENKKLQYASLEGPENGVYVRGTTDKETIELPEYWSELVHEDSITVVLTPIGKKQDLFIKEKSNKLIKIGGAEGSFDYIVYGERKDIDKLEIEPLKV